MVQQGPPLSQEDLSIIDRFKKQARDFWALYQSMKNDRTFIAVQSPEIRREYNDLMQRGKSIRGSVEKATSVIDTASGFIDDAKNWFANTFGFGAIPLPSQLGFIPLIPIAVVAGSLALIGKWVNDALIFNRRIAEMKRLETQGMSPGQAAAIIDKLMPKGFVANLGGMMLPLGLIAALLIIPKFKKRG